MSHATKDQYRAWNRMREKHLEQQVIQNLRTLGFQVSKTSQPRPSMVTIGPPDLYVSHPRWGIRLWVELKVGKNQPTPAQLSWHRVEREAGGNVLVAWSWGEVQEELVRLGAPLS